MDLNSWEQVPDDLEINDTGHNVYWVVPEWENILIIDWDSIPEKVTAIMDIISGK